MWSRDEYRYIERRFSIFHSKKRFPSIVFEIVQKIENRSAGRLDVIRNLLYYIDNNNICGRFLIIFKKPNEEK